jgi:hypothetical protein
MAGRFSGCSINFARWEGTMFEFQQQRDDRNDMKGSFNFAYVLLKGHALTGRVFTSTDFGSESMGFAGIVGFMAILVYGGMMNSYAMFLFLIAYLLAVIAQRMKQFRNRRNGVILHSHYNGYPWLALKLFPRLKEADGRAVEGFMCLAIGGLLTYVDPALGWYVMGCFFSILLSEGFDNEARRRRLQAMRDAELEVRDLAENYRQGRF